MSAKSVFLTIAAIASVAAALAVGYLMSRPREVAVMTVTPKTIEQVLSVVGRARPADLVQVASPNGGQVIRLLHDDGDTVAAGAPLAVIRATVEQAQTEAYAAQERAARAEASDARLKYQRTRTLADKGYAAPAAVESATAALQAAEANVAAASANVRAAAERTREFTILAPMSGTVLVRPIDNGQVVAAGETLFEMGSSASAEIYAEADEAYADALRPGMKARVALSGSDSIFAADVIEVSPEVDSTTGGRLIKLRPAGLDSLAPGRSIDVTIVIGQLPQAIAIPRQAIVDATAAPKVYVVDAQGVVQVRAVKVARWPSLDAIIEGGLKAGDKVVMTPAATRPGAKVRPIVAASQGH